MGENYASLFQPWWAQGKSDNIQARLGMQPMTETAKQTS
jgi:hypothetical protein